MRRRLFQKRHRGDRESFFHSRKAIPLSSGTRLGSSAAIAVDGYRSGRGVGTIDDAHAVLAFGDLEFCHTAFANEVNQCLQFAQIHDDLPFDCGSFRTRLRRPGGFLPSDNCLLLNACQCVAGRRAKSAFRWNEIRVLSGNAAISAAILCNCRYFTEKSKGGILPEHGGSPSLRPFREKAASAMIIERTDGI